MARVITISEKQDKTTTVKLEKITDIDEVKQAGAYEIKLSYQFDFVSADKETWSEKTTSYLTAKDWNKRFYVNKSGYTNYTRDQTLNALVQIFTKLGDKDVVDGMTNKSLDIDLLIGKKFEAVLLVNSENQVYCDWVATFKANGVEVPNLEPKVVDNTNIVNSTLGGEVVNTDDLPF